MSKVKMTVRTPKMDMTPMVDLFCLLLTFFMLTTSFRPQEAVQVDTPSSVSENIAPEKNVFTIYVSKEGKVFYNLDNGADSSLHIRGKVLKDMATQLQVNFTPQQIAKFEDLASFGMPLKDLPAWIDAEGSKRDAMQTGIPIDSLNNELIYWVLFSRKQNPEAFATIKGDSEADYKVVSEIFEMLKKNNVVKFNLTTNLEKVEVNINDIK